MDTVVVWRFPWSGWDPASRGQADPTAELALAASDASLVELPVGWRLRAQGAVAEPWLDRSHIATDRGPRGLWAVPTPTAANLDGAYAVHGAMDRTSGTVVPRGSVPRPKPGHAASDRALELDGLVGLLVDRFERVVASAGATGRLAETGKLQGLVRPRWEDLVTTVLEDPDVDEPAMALIVRHAQDHRKWVVDLAERPRRVLRRERRLQALDRIQEMDPQCLTWYVRRPGRTAAQKAGPRQQLLAVVRRETIDTLENRVLKDFLRRSTVEADRYLAANRALATGRRYGMVRRYANTCRRLQSVPDLEEVRPLASVPAPNYVLQQDRRYRTLWDAYLELVRRQDVLDEAWSWQRRLWADAVSVAVASVLDVAPGVRVLFQQPIYLRTEQDHGRWTEGAFPSRYAVVEGDAAPAFLEVRRGAAGRTTADDPVEALRPDVVVRATRQDGHEIGTTVFWALHGTGVQDVDEGDVRSSVLRAMERWSAMHPGRRIHGVVVRPAWAAEAPSGTSIASMATVVTVPLAAHGLGEAVARLEALARWAWSGPA